VCSGFTPLSRPLFLLPLLPPIVACPCTRGHCHQIDRLTSLFPFFPPPPFSSGPRQLAYDTRLRTSYYYELFLLLPFPPPSFPPPPATVPGVVYSQIWFFSPSFPPIYFLWGRAPDFGRAGCRPIYTVVLVSFFLFLYHFLFLRPLAGVVDTGQIKFNMPTVSPPPPSPCFSLPFFLPFPLLSGKGKKKKRQRRFFGPPPLRWYWPRFTSPPVFGKAKSGSRLPPPPPLFFPIACGLWWGLAGLEIVG